MFNRKVRTRLDLLRPSGVGESTTPDRTKIAKKVEREQMRQKRNHCRRPRGTTVAENDSVMIRNYGRHGGKWLPAQIERKIGPLTYKCKLQDGQVVKRHQDQLHQRSASLSPAPPIIRASVTTETTTPVTNSNEPGTPPRVPITQPQPRSLPRRSRRNREPVKRYGNPVPH